MRILLISPAFKASRKLYVWRL